MLQQQGSQRLDRRLSHKGGVGSTTALHSNRAGREILAGDWKQLCLTASPAPAAEITEIGQELSHKGGGGEYNTECEGTQNNIFSRNLTRIFLKLELDYKISVADPDTSDPYVFGPPGSGSISQRCMDPDPDPYVIKQK
jgi:hypothetical protein